MIRVLVVDDHHLVCHAFSELLDAASDIEVIGKAENGEDGIELAMQHRPDVVIMDIQMPGMNGIEATRKIHQSLPETRVVIVSSIENEAFPLQTKDAGAIGYLSKRCSQQELWTAVRNAYAGLPFFSSEIAQRLALSQLNGRSGMLDLTSREMEVMLNIVKGLKNKAIAETLFLSEKTVSTHKKKIFDKLGVSSDVELTHYAIRHQLIEIN